MASSEVSMSSALEECRIGSMSADAFWEAITRYPVLARSTLKRLSYLVRRLTERVIEYSTLGVKNRIHAELLRLAYEQAQESNSATLTPSPKHVEIANRISTHREAVTRELNSLEKSGVIERQRGKLLIPDVSRLATMVAEVTSGHDGG